MSDLFIVTCLFLFDLEKDNGKKPVCSVESGLIAYLIKWSSLIKCIIVVDRNLLGYMLRWNIYLVSCTEKSRGRHLSNCIWSFIQPWGTCGRKRKRRQGTTCSEARSSLEQRTKDSTKESGQIWTTLFPKKAYGWTDSRGGSKSGLPSSGLLAYSSLFVPSLQLLTSVLLCDVVKTCASKAAAHKVRSLSCFKVFVLGRKNEKGPTPSGSSLNVGGSCERLGLGLLSRLSLY